MRFTIDYFIVSSVCIDGPFGRLCRNELQPIWKIRAREAREAGGGTKFSAVRTGKSNLQSSSVFFLSHFLNLHLLPFLTFHFISSTIMLMNNERD